MWKTVESWENSPRLWKCVASEIDESSAFVARQGENRGVDI